MSLTTCVLPSGFFLTPLFICLEITKITIMCIDALNGKLECVAIRSGRTNGTFVCIIFHGWNY